MALDHTGSRMLLGGRDKGVALYRFYEEEDEAACEVEAEANFERTQALETQLLWQGA